MRARAWIRFGAVAIIPAAVVWAGAQTAGQPSEGKQTPASQPTSPEQPGPRLELSPSLFDFGEVWQGEPVAGEFTVKNAGSEPLTITMKRSCGCTPVTKPKSPLQPGESDTFTISYDTARRKGRARQRVTLITNDPSRSNVTIMVQGNVKPLYSSKPPEGLVFHRLTSDQQVTRKMTLTSQYDRPLKLELKEGQDFGPFAVEFRELTPGVEFELEVTTKPPLEGHVTRVQVVLETGLERSPELSIPVHAYVQADVTCRPSMLRVARVAVAPVPQTVRLTCRADKPVQITEVRPSTPSVKFEVLPPQPTRSNEAWLEQVVRVTLPPGDQMPPGDSVLEILTDSSDPRYDKFTIPIQVVERARPAASRPGGRAREPESPVKP